MISHLASSGIVSLIAFALICCGCAIGSRDAGSKLVELPADRLGYSVNSADFRGVYFQSGQPSLSEP